MTATVTVLPTNPQRQIPEGCITSPELVHRSGITYRQLDYWTRTGRLRPAQDATGSGTSRGYPVSEVAVATLMRRLLEAGLSLGLAHDAARQLTETGETRVAGMPLYLPQEV